MGKKRTAAFFAAVQNLSARKKAKTREVADKRPKFLNVKVAKRGQAVGFAVWLLLARLFARLELQQESIQAQPVSPKNAWHRMSDYTGVSEFSIQKLATTVESTTVRCLRYKNGARGDDPS